MKRHSFFSAITVKKAAVFAASAFLCVSLSPCRPDAAQMDIPAAPEEGAPTEDASGEEPGYDEVDIDLTVMSKTMVYAEVTNILLKPEKYIGKTIKMKGPVVTYKTKNTDGSPRYDFAVIIEDATACCQKGMEFELYGITREPDNYPEDDTRITVAGTFESYDAGRYVYYHVANAQILS